MNRVKRAYALLLAIVLALGVVLQPGIGGVYAQDTEQSEQGEQSAETTTIPEEQSVPHDEDTPVVTVSVYEQLMACGTLADFNALLSAEENMTQLDVFTQEEWKQLLEREQVIYAAIPAPSEADAVLHEEVLKKLNEHVIVTCQECGQADGHAEGCSQYTAERNHPWSGLSDSEFVAWVMDEANADMVKTIMSGEGEDYTALNARIETILSGEDSALATRVQEYLIALLKADEPKPLATDSYIYFDLAAGNVDISSTMYTGYVYLEDGTKKTVTGTHTSANRYYVYQSTVANRNQTGIPKYDRIKHDGEDWIDYVTNNTNVKEVSEAWDIAAAVNRTPTDYKINFATESDYEADVTIDNIWSRYYEASTRRTTGGIGAHLDDVSNTHIRLRLKGDNRVGCVHYSADRGSKNTIEFFDGETGDMSGSITVADFSDNYSANHWNAAIGAADNPGFQADMSDGIVIHGGVIYAGTTPEDNCTAIGGGGNNYGGITINGGKITAVVSSTGTAIGGGIGYSDKGGDTDIIINDGTIYAYNLGIQKGVGDKFGEFIPAAAIGGGGSNGSAGGLDANITINGGTIYAQSMGGAAIGGGCSASGDGGPATITINGGTIIAKSVKGMYGTDEIDAGVSIGGGTGKTGGGSVTLTITEDKGETFVRTGSIGGGSATGSGNIGSANVTITAGDITGQVIMEGGATKNCTFYMSGGEIHDTNVIDGNIIDEPGITDPQPDVPISYLEENGGAVWMQDANGITEISGGTIRDCTAKLGGAIYMTGGRFTLSGTGTISGNTAQATDNSGTSGLGGGIYVDGGNASVTNGSIKQNNAGIRGGGIYVTGGDVMVSGGMISENRAEGRGGGVCLPDGNFTMTGGVISNNTAGIRGGGIWLTKKPTLTKGVISGNVAADSGGGLCLNGDAVELTSADMQIYGNRAEKGGGIAVLNGDFILNGGAVGVENAAVNYAKRGGGVYVEAENSGSAANAIVYDGNIWYNEAEQGGGVYLANGQGNFRLEGANASISHNTAKDGGGIYLYKDPFLNQGTIEQNTATENGGGLYISDCIVTLNPTNDVIITGNGAKNGGGIYIHNSQGNSAGSGGSDVDTGATGTDTQKVGLLVDSNCTGTVSFTNNEATENGGAVCIDTGRFYLQSDRITITGNQAVNGGGVAVLRGNFTMSDGSIGEENGANKATNGGGVYVSGGEVWLKGGSVKYNEATDGGGAYVTGGQFIMQDGAIEHNIAGENGGGGYVAGNFRMLGGTIGGNGNGNSAKNGGGFYVNDGDVTVVYGDISHNNASQDGGGIFVSATNREVQVVMLSGSLSNNKADVNGGGMAVESSNSQKITVEIGCLLNHYNSSGVLSYPFAYTGADYGSYAEFDGVHYEHESCPQVEYNQAGSIGGGFYLNSDVSTLYFFCVEETGNSSAQNKQDSEGMDVEGGRVIIGDEYYHNYRHDAGQADPHGVPWGYVLMDNATLVNGGQVDIYGDMTNPVFKEEVTVDIQDPQADHFMDHRRSEDGKRYKVHYIENFFGTGTYQAMQYDESNATITIEGALFSHPGYEILGWYTKADYNPAETDPTNRFYPVGETFDLTDSGQVPNLGQNSSQCEHCDSEKDENLLMLYAIWQANGYTVVFDPNVPQGDTYTGSMENQIHQYGVEKELDINKYQYKGHFFTSWNTKADGTGTAYGDGATVSNLTDKNGSTVVLYAQWRECDHSDADLWSYSVIDDGKTIQRDCACGGQTLTATLNATNAVYDGHTHSAELICDDETAWGQDKPTVTYTGERFNDGLVHDTPLDYRDGIPYHAGMYTASIVKKDVKASVDYTIEKANQPTPSKPEYSVTDANLNVKKLDKDPRKFQDAAGNWLEAKVQYRLTYYLGDDLQYTDWTTAADGDTTVGITMENAWTSYNVEVRYEELDDYNASEIIRADAVYHYSGNVTVKIICDEGIKYQFVYSDGNGLTSNGASLKLANDPDYYIVSGKYSVQAQLTTAAGDTPVVPGELSATEYSFTGIPQDSTLTIRIGTARKLPQTTKQVKARQIFSAFTGTKTAISRDSAFTAAFQINNFDPYYVHQDGTSYGAYDGLKLTFDTEIPQGTKMILVDRRDGSYWYCHVNQATNAVPLTEFKEMGGNSNKTYSIPHPADANGYIDLSYQVIVDFSQSNGGCLGDSLTMGLEAMIKNGLTNVPAVKPEVTVSLGDSAFTFEKVTDTDGLSYDFECGFNTDVVASKWEKRGSALVLTPKAGTVLPSDARIKVTVNNTVTYVYPSSYQSGSETVNSFIVPLSLLQAGTEAVNLTLQSDLFPVEETNYSFTVQWLASPSESSKAPLRGDEEGMLAEVTFVSVQKAAPSLKSNGQQRVVTGQYPLELAIEKKNMDDYSISAALLRKAEDGTYIGTGWNDSNVTGNHLSVPLRGHDPGSFCLMLTVKEKDSITIVMEVPYYFIIK